MYVKKIASFLAIAILAMHAQTALAAVPAHILGRILLQVEEHGEAWYVPPELGQRLYIRNGAEAYVSLRTFGLGITNADLAKIPVGIEDRFEDLDTDGDGLQDKLEEALTTSVTDTDSDDDGVNDRAEVEVGRNPVGIGYMTTDSALVDRLRGRILLQVESRGEAWYIHPVDGKRYYMKDGDAAYQIMRFLSLGITNADLETIPIMTLSGGSGQDCGDDLLCLADAIDSDTEAYATQYVSITLLDILLETTAELQHTPADAGGVYTFTSTVVEQKTDGIVQTVMIGTTMTCTYTDKQAMVDVMERWAVGTSSTSDMDFATCTTVMPNL